MKSIKGLIIHNILRDFRDLPQLAQHLVDKLVEAETPEEFADYCYRLAQRIQWIINPDDYRSNWHSIYCECDECMRLQYGDEDCD